ncbi:MAG: glycosyltransferase family 4 protein [Sphingopyxis sp.]
MGKSVLFLATDAHGAGGGIAQYNRDVIDALAGMECVEQINVLPRHGNGRHDNAPLKTSYPPRQPHGRAAYVWLLLRAVLGLKTDLIYCAHINLLSLAWLAKRITGAPIVLVLYGIDAWGKPPRLMRWMLQSVDALASISQITLDCFTAWAGPLPCPVHILPNAIDVTRFGTGKANPVLAARWGLDGGPFIMTFGRMSASERYKGFDEVLDALPRLCATIPSLRYILAGDGDDRPRLEAKAQALGVAPHCVFIGYLPESEKADAFRLADAYVMPSHGEGFGFVVLEALACGIPVVVSTTDGTFEAVRGGLLGRAVDPAESQALVDAIIAAVRTPKAIPAGLDYFNTAQFAARLRAAIMPLLGVQLPKG